MFRTISNTADPISCSEPRESFRHVNRRQDDKTSSRTSSPAHDDDEIERASSRRHHGEEIEDEEKGAAGGKNSTTLKRTASNALSKIASRVTTRDIADPPPPPNGGLKAWTQVAMGWLVIFTTWGWVNSYGAFQSYYELNMDVPASTISWIGTLQNFLTFFIGAFSGRLLDAGLFVPTLAAGALIQVFGMFMMSLSTAYWQLLLTQGILTGLGGGIFFTPSMGLIATYFSTRRAVAICIASTGNAIGGVVYPLVVRQLIPQVGFAWTVRVLGFINLACLSLALAFMRPRLPPRKSGALIDWTAFHEKPFVLFVSGLFFLIFSSYFTFYYISSFGVRILCMPYSASTNLVIVLNGIGVPARLISGFIVDRHGALNTLVPILFCLHIVTWSWLAVTSVPGFYAWTCVYGFANAMFQAIIPATVASLCPRLEVVGTRLGMNFSFISFAALTGPPIGGAIQSAQGGRYTGSQIWSALCVCVCLGFQCWARMEKTGGKMRGKV